MLLKEEGYEDIARLQYTEFHNFQFSVDEIHSLSSPVAFLNNSLFVIHIPTKNHPQICSFEVPACEYQNLNTLA